MQVRIALFGQPRVVSEDGSREFELPRKTLHVLAYVILNRRRPLARDSVAFALFPDEDEERARSSLRRNLSYLLRSLPAGKRFLTIDAERIAWNPDAPATVDVIAFEQALRAGRDDAALAEYGGQLLPTVYDEWTVVDRERLRDLYHEALTRTIARERSQRKYEAATAYAHRLLEDDPWREDVLRLLMAIRHEAGDRAGALAALERFAQRLHDELGAEPMPETIALRDDVLRGARLPTSEPARASPSTSAVDAGLKFVGRDAAMESAREAWHAAADGRAGVLFVEGEAGSGKSRFVTELARLVESEGGVVLRGYTTSGGEHRPYEAFVDSLRTAPEVLDEHAGATLTDDRSARLRLFESVRRHLTQRSHARPLAVVLEDLHWAGSAAIDLLEFVAARLERSPVLLVATLRSEEMARAHPLRALIRQLTSRSSAHVLLERLTNGQAFEALRFALSDAVSDEDVRNAVAWAGGLPLMLSEALRDLAAGRRLQAPDIAELVGERFARLSENAETALIFGAVAGERFELSTLVSATGWRDGEIVDAVGESIEAGLVRAASRAPGLSFAFTHDLIRAAALERIAPADRSRAHGLMARALVSGGTASGARAGEVAHHFEEAGEPVRAAEYWAHAARHALDVFANEEACDAATLGLNAIGAEDRSHPGLRYQLLSLREEAVTRRGAPEQRRTDARAMVETAGNDAQRVSALRRLFDAVRDDAEERAGVLRELEALVPSSPEAEGAYHLARARDAFITAAYEKAREAANAAAEAFDRAGGTRDAMNARFLAIYALGRMGRFDDASAAVADLQSVVDDADDLGLQMEFHRVAASAADDSKRDAVIAHSRRSLDLALRLGDRYAEARARQNVAWGAAKTGDFEAALSENEATLAAFRDVDDVTGTTDAIFNIAAVRLFCGDVPGAQSVLDTLAEAQVESPWLSFKATVARGMIALRSERFAQARELFAEAKAKAIGLGTALHCARCDFFLASTYASEGTRSDALARAEAARDAFVSLGQPSLAAEAHAFCARLYAASAQAERSRDSAAAAEAIAAKETLQSYSEVAWNLSLAYTALGERDAAYERACACIAAGVRDALHMPANLAETYLALPWHVEASALIMKTPAV